MSVINFAVPKTLENRIDKTIKEKGFASKAEFFRFAAVHFLDIVQRPMASEDERFVFLTEALRREVEKKYKGRRVPSLKEQLSDV